MSFTIGDHQSDVLQGGQITFRQMFETYPGSGAAGSASGVTIGITAAPTPAAGNGTPVAPTSQGVQALGGSIYEYVWTCPQDQATGEYTVTWSGLVGGTTQVAYAQTVTVAAVPTGAPAPGMYATVAQYRVHSRPRDLLTPDDVVADMLGLASEAMDHYLIGAVYATNANGMPTDPELLDVMVRATSAQCQFMLADDDPFGVKRQYTSTSMGGVSAVRAPGTTGMPFPPLAPRAAIILHTAGVLQTAPLVAW